MRNELYGHATIVSCPFAVPNSLFPILLWHSAAIYEKSYSHINQISIFSLCRGLLLLALGAAGISYAVDPYQQTKA
ncbi:MAG TPA: hypothetical protein VKA92_02745, partial [Segetibacter sp.]|nr:hypothetical protein [Segetibacter sp.]